MQLNTIQFHFLPDGTVDCWFQYEGGATTSFDPAQRPDQLKELLGDLTPAALASKVAAEFKASSLQAEADAKDANLQKLLAEAATRAEENLSLRHEVIALRAKTLGQDPPPPLEEWRKQFEEPTITTDGQGNVFIEGDGIVTDREFGPS